MPHIVDRMDAPPPPRPSLLEIPLLAAGAEVTFATLVDAWTGAPPALEGTLLFGVGLGAALLVQRIVAQRPTRSITRPLRDP